MRGRIVRMNMERKAQDQIAFFLTGRHNGSALRPLDRVYRPALFARYGDLTSLRYDFPLVLNTQLDHPERALLSLSGLVDDAVNALQEDVDRDRIARHGYELEHQLRRELAHAHAGVPACHGDFATLWNAAAANLAAEDKTVEDSAKRLWKLFQASGELVDIDFALPARLARHVWSEVQANKTRAFRNQVERLLLNLRSVLEAEIANSEIGRSPERLKASVGASFANAFDFDVMSNVLVRAKPGVRISDDRRNRIQHLIDVLEHQRFFPMDDRSSGRNTQPYEFLFYRAASALKAYKERHHEAIELVKSLAIAKLEVKGEYRESGNVDDRSSTDVALDHTTIFEDFGLDGLDADQLASLPDYLVCKYSSELDAEETMQIVDALSTGLPIKILLQTDDLLEPSVARSKAGAQERHGGLATRSRYVVESAIGHTDVFVLQSSVSQVFRLRDAMLRGMSYHGPAFFSVFSGSSLKGAGAPGHSGDVPAYLVAAAAVESRAFPTLVYDPSAGHDRATRFMMDHNPAAAFEWPVHTFEFENESHETQSETMAFTLADFIAMDARFKEHFAIVSKTDWNHAMISVSDSLKHNPKELPIAIPSIALLDAEGCLQRAIVDRRILEETRRSQNRWRSMQELGGIHNSHAVSGIVEQAKAELAKGAKSVDDNAAVTMSETVTVIEDSIAEVTVSHGDDPYIETARCTTCNECTQINNKMFAYNEDKQARIADPDAGTFRQLVEAAEGCQVSIIHPGKPRNPKEPGLDELMIRATQFN